MLTHFSLKGPAIGGAGGAGPSGPLLQPAKEMNAKNTSKFFIIVFLFS
jgi:hypothetical protein